MSEGEWKSDADNYVCSTKKYDDKKMRKAVDKVRKRTKRYHPVPVFGSNCQSAVEDILNEYNRAE